MKQAHLAVGFILIMTSSWPALAAEANCGQPKPEWRACKTAADCTLIDDGCGMIRMATSKASAKDAQAFYTCHSKGSTCPQMSPEQKNPALIVKCEAYGVKFPNAKPPKLECMRLTDIVGMAINNDDLARIEAAITESGDVDMSLSHIHETPLTLAAMNSKVEQVRWLLGKGAKVNFRTTNGYTALMFAAMSRASDKKNVLETITLLLKSGADKTLRNGRGESAHDLAVQVKNQDVVKLLK